ASVIEADFDRGPFRAEREPLRPLDDHDSFFGQGVLQAKRFKVVKAFNAIEIDVIDLARRRTMLRTRRDSFAELMDEIERGTGDVFFPGGAQSTDDSLGQCGLAAAEISLQKNKHRRLESLRDFSAFSDGFFGG